MSEDKAQEPTLAQRCYREEESQMELFTKVNEILGADSEKCLEPGFKWEALDTRTDRYDGSIEVIRPADSTSMTRDQADAILAMGFFQIYESIGEYGLNWRKESRGACSPREADERLQTAAKLKQARDENERLRAQLAAQDQLLGAIPGRRSTGDARPQYGWHTPPKSNETLERAFDTCDER
jgi:hypothetical protein